MMINKYIDINADFLRGFILISFLILIASSCKVYKDEMILPGKIIKRPVQTNRCIGYFEGKDIKEFNLSSGEKNYSGLVWLNTQDKFIAIEGIQDKFGKTYLSNLVLLDTNGQALEKILENKRGFYVGAAFPSGDDTRLLIFTKNSIDGMFCWNYTLNIMDFNTRTIVKRVNNFLPKCSMLYLDESPWSPDKTKFVYAISEGVRVLEAGQLRSKDNYVNKNFKKHGMYIYDLESERDQLIDLESFFAVWSPKSDSIAYIKNNNIWFYNSTTKHHSLFYKAEPDENIKNIHWSPDGDYLFVICPKKRLYNEKLIRISDGNSVSFKKANIRESYYTWKK